MVTNMSKYIIACNISHHTILYHQCLVWIVSFLIRRLSESRRKTTDSMIPDDSASQNQLVFAWILSDCVTPNQLFPSWETLFLISGRTIEISWDLIRFLRVLTSSIVYHFDLYQNFLNALFEGSVRISLYSNHCV